MPQWPIVSLTGWSTILMTIALSLMISLTVDFVHTSLVVAWTILLICVWSSLRSPPNLFAASTGSFTATYAMMSHKNLARSLSNDRKFGTSMARILRGILCTVMPRPNKKNQLGILK